MHKQSIIALVILTLIFVSLNSKSQFYQEIDGSPYATSDAPIAEYIHPLGEKLVVIDPREHVWGAYNLNGKLIRWGIASAGANFCADTRLSCRTKSGSFRIYLMGESNCSSNKYPIPGGGSPMPYCMYFHGNQALHGSNEVEYENISHGCVRVHIDDAKWLRYHFVEGPDSNNNYLGTKILIKDY